MFDEDKLLQTFVALRIGGIKHSDCTVVGLHSLGDGYIEATALIQIGLTVAAKNHVACRQRVHIRLLLYTDQTLLPDVGAFAFGDGLPHHLLHR